MRTVVALVVLLLGFQEKPPTPREELMKGVKAPWEGFGVGTWMKLKQVQADRMNTTTLVMKRVLKEIVDKNNAVFVYRYDNGAESEFTEDIGVDPALTNGDVTKRAEKEKVQLGDAALECDVFEVKQGGDRDKLLSVYWKAPGATWPWVRCTRETFVAGRREQWMEEKVSKMEDVVTLNGREYKCVVFSRDENTLSGMKGGRREWRTMEVPGHVLKYEVKTSNRETFEVLEFEAKPEQKK